MRGEQNRAINVAAIGRVAQRYEHYVDIVGVTGSIPVAPTDSSEVKIKFIRLWDTPVVMKKRSSLRTLKTRHKDCQIVRRRGRVYVINKTQRRFKARQG